MVNSAEILRQFFGSSQISTGVASMHYSGSTMLNLRLAPQMWPISKKSTVFGHHSNFILLLSMVVGLGIVPSLTVKGHLGLSLAYGKQPNAFGIYFSQFCEQLYLTLQKIESMHSSFDYDILFCRGCGIVRPRCY